MYHLLLSTLKADNGRVIQWTLFHEYVQQQLANSAAALKAQYAVRASEIFCQEMLECACEITLCFVLFGTAVLT